jgi:hypothetical protein
LFRGAQPLTNDSVSLSSSNYWSQGFELRVSDTNGWFWTACRAETDGSGHFVFDRVPPGEFYLDWTDPIPGKQVPRWPVKTEAGKTAVVELNILNSPRPQTATDGEVERKGNLEELKRFLASPPPLEYALYYVTNDSASRFRTSSPTRQEGSGAAESSIEIFEGSWCNGNFWMRWFGPGSASPLGPVSGAFVGRSGDIYWNAVGPAVFTQTVRERERESLAKYSYARPFGEEKFLRILTLGIYVAQSGTFQFDGNGFIVDQGVGPKTHGELLVTNGWVTGIRLERLEAVNSYSIFEFTYDRNRDQLPWFFPSEITQKVYHKTGEFTTEGYHAVFLKLQIADRELPPGRFLPDGIVVPVGATNLLAGLPSPNPTYFLVGPGGKLIETNSKVFFTGQGGGAPFESVGNSKVGFTNARPFSVKGRVTDPLGNGIAGVTITAHCGMGTLFPTGETNTDAEGRYVLRFREGMKGFDESSGQWRVAVQAATISPRKAGWFETNLYRGGDLLMADKLPAPNENVGWKLDPAKVVLPDRPYELNFVMQPAARIVGQLSDELERPMARTKIWIDGELPPSSSVLAETETDAAGRFRFEDVPTGYFWNFNIASAAGMTTRFESPGELSLYLRVRDSRGRKVLGPVAPPGETMNADTQSRTSTPPSIEISLGLRSVTGIEFRGSREFKYPLAFRVKNVGQTALSGREIPQLLFDAVLHARSADGVDRTNAFRQFWMGFAPQDLAPGEMYEDWINGDLLTYFSSVSNGVYEVWWTLRDLKSNSLRFEVAKGEMRLVTDPVVVSSAVPPQLIERPPQPKGAGAVSVRDRIEQLIRSAPVTTNFDLEIWEPGARNAFTIRSNVVQLAYYNEGGLDSNSVFGMVYHLPAQNRFYVGWDAFRSEPRHYYGPFTGNPFEVLGARSGNAWEQDAHRPDSKRVEPDNPLGLDDETLVRLFNLGKKLQQVAWNIALPPSNSKIVFHSVDEVYTNYINRDELGSDPFGSGTLRLERTGSKVHIYSVGPDGEWNRGELIQPGDAELKGDLGVEVEIGKSDIHWLAEGALLDYLQGKHTARYLAKKGTHYAVQFPLPGWADEKLKFGPMTDGLRAAVELTATKGRFVFGQPIGVRFHIRNEADYAIQITSASWRNEDKAIIEDEQGKTRPTGHIMYIGTSAQVRKILKPGETATFQSSSLEFFTEENAQSANAVRHPVGYTVTLKPGKCTIRFRLRLPGWNAQLMDWQGELETGPVVLDLKPLSEASTGQGTEGRKLFALSALSAVKFSSDSP